MCGYKQGKELTDFGSTISGSRHEETRKFLRCPGFLHQTSAFWKNFLALTIGFVLISSSLSIAWEVMSRSLRGHLVQPTENFIELYEEKKTWFKIGTDMCKELGPIRLTVHERIQNPQHLPAPKAAQLYKLMSSALECGTGKISHELFNKESCWKRGVNEEP